MSKRKRVELNGEHFLPFKKQLQSLTENDLHRIFNEAKGLTEQVYDENKGTAQKTGVTTTAITSLEEAIEFFNVDTDEWIVERWICNAWDVTMKIDKTPVKRTNYQVKVWLVKKVSQIKEIKYELLKSRFTEAVKIPKSDSYQMWVVLGCIHRPFHDKDIWSKLMSFLNEYKKQITGIIINGDYLDLKTLSGYEQGEVPIEGLTLKSEYEDGYVGILDIKKAAGKEYERWDKHFIYGNHENRFFKMLKKPDFYKLGIDKPCEALKLEENGYTIQRNYPDSYVLLGDSCKVYHGVYFSDNAAAAHLKKDPEFDGIFFHTHRFGYASNGSHQVFNCGWLGDPDSIGFQYANRFLKSQWQHGFAVAYVDQTNRTVVRPIEIHNKSFFFEGRQF